MRRFIYWGLLLVLLAGAAWAGNMLWRYGDAIKRRIELERQHVAEWGAMQEEHLDKQFLQQIREMQFHNDTQRIDYVRELVYANSEDALDEGRNEEGLRNYKNLQRMTRFWAQCFDGADGECAKPELKCDHRAKAMIAILQALGIDARLVHLFNPGLEGQKEDHSVCEVLNPDSGRWELQDPYFNCYFMTRCALHRRGGALEILYRGLDGYMPCNASGCGWEYVRPGLRQKYANLMRGVVFDRRETARPSLAVISLLRAGQGATPEKIRALEYHGFMQRNYASLQVVFD